MKDENKDYVLDRFGKPLAKLRFTKACSNTIRLVTSIKENENNPEKIAPHQEDHPFDCDRYFAMSRPRPRKSEKEKRRSTRRRERLMKPRSSVTGY
jgi:hypothetical protein